MMSGAGDNDLSEQIAVMTADLERQIAERRLARLVRERRHLRLVGDDERAVGCRPHPNGG